MMRDYSLAHLTVLSLSPPEVVDVAARAGYRYVGLRLTKVTSNEPFHDLLNDRVLMRETKARLANSPVDVLDVELFRMDPATGPDGFAPVLEAAAELGARQIIAQVPDPDEARAIERFGRLCDLAKPLELFVSLEFPHWTETGNLSAAAKIIRAADRSNSGILVDTLHFSRSGSSIEELALLPRKWFRFAHVCDAVKEIPPTLPGIIRTAREERLFPGEGGLDLKGILSRLPQDIPYALEIPRTALTKAVGPEEVARLAIRVSRSELDNTSRATGPTRNVRNLASGAR